MSQAKQLEVILREQQLETNAASALLEAFGAPFEEAGEILADYQLIKVESEDDKKTMTEARTKRLALKRVRTTVENRRKELKADIVKQGRAIDSVARFVKEVISPAEEYLQLQEDYAAIKAKERADALLAEREGKLRDYVEDITVYDLAKMTDEQFQTLLDTEKANYQARQEAVRKAQEEAEAAAKAEAERQAQIEAENARLRAEAEAERKRREELEAAERARAADEARAKAEADRLEREALEASDPEKLRRFAVAIHTIRTEKLPSMSTARGSATVTVIADALESLEKTIEDSIAKFSSEEETQL